MTIQFIKDHSWIIGSVGGVLGCIGFFFSFSDYIKNHITKPNQLLFTNYFTSKYTECFHDEKLRDTNGFNFNNIITLNSQVMYFHSINGNQFKGLRSKYYYWRLYTFAKKFEPIIDREFLVWYRIYESNHESVIKAYEKHHKSLALMEKKYRQFCQYVNKIVL
jgi:hypothetical protein